MAQKCSCRFRTKRRAQGNNISPSHRVRNCRLSLEALEQRQLLSVDPVVSEFMASNSTALTDYYGKASDWLEIFNPDTAALSAAGISSSLAFDQ